MKSQRFTINTLHWKQKMMAFAVTLLIVAVLLVLNLLVTVLSSRMDLQLDVSAGQVFQVSEQTTQLIATIDTPVDLFVCVSETDFLAYENTNQRYKQVGELLRYYERQSSYLSLQYIDLLRQPGFFRDHPDVVIEQGSLVVVGKGRIRVLSLDELFQTETNSSTGEKIMVSYAESKLAAAISGVISGVNERVLRLTGYGTTASADGLTSLLSDQGYVVSDHDITTQDPDPKAAIAILCEPMEDFTQIEVDRLHSFLDKNGKLGGTLVYLPSIEQSKLPRLHRLLADWGIALEEGLVAETDTGNMYNNNPYFLAVTLIDEAYAPATDTKTEQRLMSYQSRPLTPLWEKQGTGSTSVIAASPESTVVVGLDLEDSFDVTTLVPSAHPVMMVGRRVAYAGTSPQYSNLLVFGGDGMVHPDLLASGNFSNANVTLSVLHTLLGREEVGSIPPVVFAAEPLQLSTRQINVWSGLFVVVIPSIVLLISFFLWRKRRHQ